MRVIETLLDKTARLLGVGEQGISDLMCALENCKKSGAVSVHTIRSFANYGFPIVEPISTIMGVTTKAVVDDIDNKKVTYEDLVCVISIFAQDIKLRSQYGR